MASNWAALLIRKRAPAVKSRNQGAWGHWSQTPAWMELRAATMTRWRRPVEHAQEKAQEGSDWCTLACPFNAQLWFLSSDFPQRTQECFHLRSGCAVRITRGGWTARGIKPAPPRTCAPLPMHTAWPTQPLRAWWHPGGQQVWGPRPCNCGLTSPWPTLVEVPCTGLRSQVQAVCASSCSVSGQKTDRTEGVSERTMELSGHRPWAGHVLTLPHPACPHLGSGWTTGWCREQRGGFISGVLGGFSVSELQVRTFAEKGF